MNPGRQLYVACLSQAFAIGYSGEPFIFAKEGPMCSRNWAKIHKEDVIEKINPYIDLIPIENVVETSMTNSGEYLALVKWYNLYINNVPITQTIKTSNTSF